MTYTTTDAGSVPVVSRSEMATTRARIAQYISHTPTIRLPWLDTPNREVWAKLECLQVSGSVKARSAFHILTSLEPGQRFVTASGGNHGLAVATAAAHLGHPCVGFVPLDAPTVRTRRIVELGARVEVFGANLNETLDHATAYAERHGLPFVSPFGGIGTAIALATCFAEAIDDVGPFDSLVVPLGSGGLLAGCGAFATEALPELELVAAHPAAFGRPFGLRPLAECLSQPFTPSLANSLALRARISDELGQVLNRLRAKVYEVSEPTIALGIYALLHRQSLLVEGAGAAAAGAMLTDSAPTAAGRVLVVLTGGNISSSDLARAYAVDVFDPRIRRRLGLRRRTPILNAASVFAHQQSSTPDHPSERRTSPKVDSGHLQPLPALDDAVDLLQEHRRYTDAAELTRSPSAHRALDQVLAAALQLQRQVTRDGGPQEDDIRLLHRLKGFLHQAMEWASPAHDQSRRINFYDPAVQMPDIANYARYGDATLHQLELVLADMLGFTRDDVELLATSSGMAAYQLIESYLIRHVLDAGDTVLCTPYVYFEVREQLTTLPLYRHLEAASFQPRQLVADANTHNARVVFVDPVANVAGLPTVDLRELASLTVGQPTWSNRWLVIDGTMISGGLDVYELFPPSNGPKVLYYESASKYAQLGLDLHMAGTCVIPRSIASQFRVLRRNTGTVLYPDAVDRFPRAGRSMFLARMLQMSANAKEFAHRIRHEETLKGQLEVGVIDDWSDRGWQHGGGVVTLKFCESGMNNRDVLEAMIGRLLQIAREHRIPLVRGVSFGLSTTRVSAASSTAEFHDPFLRFSIGVESRAELQRLANLVVEAVIRHIASLG